jgi:hypothetical protein
MTILIESYSVSYYNAYFILFFTHELISNQLSLLITTIILSPKSPSLYSYHEFYSVYLY